MNLTTADPSQTETVLAPSNRWTLVRWRDLWAYRDLLMLLVWRDVTTRYKQTILGPIWFVVQPLVTTLVFFVIFKQVADISTDHIPGPLFYLCGQLAWNYFAQSLAGTATTFTSNASLFGKVYFPRLIVPFAGVLSNLVAAAIQLATFFVFFIIYKFTPEAANFHLSPSVVLLPLVFLQVAVFSVGAGLFLSAMTAKFRDFAVLTGFIIQLWMYATPIIYPLSRVGPNWRTLVLLNPMTVPVEATKIMLVGAGTMTPGAVGLCVGETLLVLLGGLFLFQRVERTFIDVI